ncbi:MAG: hypothetical protein AAF078_10570, partial [Planctomycetota bacterium]
EVVVGREEGVVDRGELWLYFAAVPEDDGRLRLTNWDQDALAALREEPELAAIDDAFLTADDDLDVDETPIFTETAVLEHRPQLLAIVADHAQRLPVTDLTLEPMTRDQLADRYGEDVEAFLESLDAEED